MDELERLTGNSVSENFRQRYLKGADELELVRSGLDDTMRIAYQAMAEVWRTRDDVTDLVGFLLTEPAVCVRRAEN